MRAINTYVPTVAPPQDPHRSLLVEAGDNRPPGNAPVHYTVTVNPHLANDKGRWLLEIPFHYHYPPELPPMSPVHAMGVTNEVLLAIVADRLEAFQAGEFACPENALALHHVLAALSSLHYRASGRAQRGAGPTEK